MSWVFDNILVWHNIMQPFPVKSASSKENREARILWKTFDKGSNGSTKSHQKIFFLFKHFVIASFMYTSNGDLNIWKGFLFTHYYLQWQDLCSVNFDSLQRYGLLKGVNGNQRSAQIWCVLYIPVLKKNWVKMCVESHVKFSIYSDEFTKCLWI